MLREQRFGRLAIAAAFVVVGCGGDGGVEPGGLVPDGGPVGSDASAVDLDGSADTDATLPPYTGPRPATPVITEPAVELQLVNGSDVHMECAPFQHDDPEREHVCSDWEIWTTSPRERVWFASCVRGVERVHVHLGDGDFEGALERQRMLAPEREHLLRVRHRDDSGHPEGQWSEYAERRFRTRALREPLPGAPDWIVSADGFVVEEVATGFQLPVNIAFVPGSTRADDEPFFYVTELYGTIKVVTGDYTVSDYATDLLNYDPGGRFPGSGEQGLAGIVVDPATGDVLASMLYEAEGAHYPRVVRFESDDGGRTSSRMTTLLDMPGEIMGAAHQISALTIGPDGHLYVQMGDGFDIPTALDLDSFRGKILRVALDGSAPSDNPFYDAADGISARDYVFAYGFRNPFGATWRESDGRLFSVDNGAAVDRMMRIDAGASYGWAGTDASLRPDAIYVWEPSTAPVNITFVEPTRFHGSGFPAERQGRAYVSESGPTFAIGPQTRGKRITEFVIAADGRSTSEPVTIVEYNGTGASTIVGLASGPDGLYFTSLYPADPATLPTAPGASIFRVRYAPGE